ncbi:cysteine peptidase, Clan CA, family C19 [Angomonas deanei]|nr:cysteine peptidase, Clan CA, family C19 [Angomonas deanei]|eukprot:EPY37733.1 cysteine peptidase, Clan CA, family C19 [Angomonas deanei]
MEVYDRVLGLQNKTIVYRPIDFVRYRKPQIVEYPRHATVLNPHHAQQQSRQHQQQQREEEEALQADEAQRGEEDGDSDDDDDPRRLDPADRICSDAMLRQVMHLRWREVGPVGIGLQNIGNTCFANSVLQCLAYTPALAQYFSTSFKAPDSQLGAPYDFAYALGEVIRQVHLRKGGSGGAYKPGIVLGHLRALSSHMRLGQQCDAHEFAVQLLFACQKSILFRQFGSKKIQPRVAHTTALYRICGGYLRSQVSWDVREEMQQLKREGKKQAAMDLRLVWENKSRKRTEDANSHKLHSNAYDPFTILNVELAGKTLYHCLDQFCEEETLDGRIYQTPREVKVRATKRFHIHCAPPVLIIQLKRFTGTGAKNSRHVQYPTTLDISPYCLDTSVSCRYTLNAVSVHEGRSINYGHYYAVVKARNGAWYECNDSHVSSLSVESAMQKQAYMLFYTRVETSGNGKEGAPERRSVVRVAPPPVRETPAADLGREITEEEVQRRLRQLEKRASPPLSPGKRPRAEEEEDTSSEEEEPARLTMKPRSSAHAAMGEEEEQEEEEEEERAPAEDKTRTSIPSRYSGLVRALKKHNTPPTGTAGRQAVNALRRAKQQATPDTVARPANAPKFQQKIRDPLWEMEMDKGRVKKVKSKHTEERSECELLPAGRQDEVIDIRGRRKPS